MGEVGSRGGDLQGERVAQLSSLRAAWGWGAREQDPAARRSAKQRSPAQRSSGWQAQRSAARRSRAAARRTAPAPRSIPSLDAGARLEKSKTGSGPLKKAAKQAPPPPPHSMFTYDSPPEMEGQQLMDSGTTPSSRVCAGGNQREHFNDRLYGCAEGGPGRGGGARAGPRGARGARLPPSALTSALHCVGCLAQALPCPARPRLATPAPSPTPTCPPPPTPHLQPPLEHAQRSAGGEGPVGVLERQHALVAARESRGAGEAGCVGKGWCQNKLPPNTCKLRPLFKATHGALANVGPLPPGRAAHHAGADQP